MVNIINPMAALSKESNSVAATKISGKSRAQQRKKNTTSHDATKRLACAKEGPCIGTISLECKIPYIVAGRLVYVKQIQYTGTPKKEWTS